LARNESGLMGMTNLSVIRGTGAKTSKKVEAMSVAKLRAILEDERMRHREPKETFEAFEERLHGNPSTNGV
jgi:hypothetical protein